MTTTERTRKVQACSVLFMLIAQLFVSPVGSANIASMSPLSSSPVTYVMTRSEAYYLEAIPPPNGPNLLAFDWNVSVSYPGTGFGSIQFSHDNSTWSNLKSFFLVVGEAQGKQTVDSSWAQPDTNYLRASYNQSSSEVLILKVFVNYSSTILLILSPFIAGGVLGGAIYFVKKRDKRSTPPTL